MKFIAFVFILFLNGSCHEPTVQQVFYGEQQESEQLDSVMINVNGKAYNVNVAVYDSMSILEGDIQIMDKEKDTAFSLLGNVEYGRLWEQQTIPYRLSADLTGSLLENIDFAIRHWMEKTGLKFVKQTDEKDFIVFEKGKSPTIGSSLEGKMGKMQKIKLGTQTGKAVAIHEIGHSMGLWHEQSRTDRDTYVEILYENISRIGRANFGKWGTAFGPYDFNSRMHYSPRTFSRNGKETMRSRIPGKEIANDGLLSEGDIATIKHLYKL